MGWQIRFGNTAGEWGSVELSYIHSVLGLCANVFLQNFQSGLDRVVEIRSCSIGSALTGLPNYLCDSPMVIYDHLHTRETTLVLLTARDAYYSQYIYQLGHELCHVVSNYNSYQLQQNIQNNWFIESICEIASLYTLRKTSEIWLNTPPYKDGHNYAHSIYKYYSDYATDANRIISEPFVEWFKANETSMKLNLLLREKNNIVANQLMKHFTPFTWQSIRYLNLNRPRTDVDFTSYLLNWVDNAPPMYHQFINTIANEFGINLAVP